MSDNAQISQVFPGLCPPEGCPPPTRIECIVVDKVYDSCFQIDDFTRTTEIETNGSFTGPFSVGDLLNCRLNDDIFCEEINRVSVGGGFSSITIRVTVPVRLTNPNNPNQYVIRDFIFFKTVTLCCPPGVEPDCSESTLVACTCFVTEVDGDEIEVTCQLQVCLVTKCILRVQLLVPSYGFCVPAPCVTLPGVCPPTPPAQCF